MAEALSRLIYHSRCALHGTPEERAAEVAGILRGSRANNAKSGLTGVLLFDGNHFLQAVEGPLAELERVYETIARDRRHEEIVLIDLSCIEAREYDAWSMGFLDGTDSSRPLLHRLMARQLDPNAARSGRTLSGAMKALLLRST